MVAELYDTLSAEYVERSQGMKPGTWRARAFFALESSLAVLSPHRPTLAALIPVLVGDPEQGLFSKRTAVSRARVQQAFIDAVTGAKEKLSSLDAEALGRLLYVIHLTVILWWLLDKSPKQQATQALVAILKSLASTAALALRLPRARATVRRLDVLVREGLLGEAS